MSVLRWMMKSMKRATGQMSNGNNNQNEESLSDPLPPEKVYSVLDQNLEYLKTAFGQTQGIVYRNFQAGKTTKQRVLLVAVSGMVKKETINKQIIGPLMNMEQPEGYEDLVGYLQESVLSVMNIEPKRDLKTIVSDILSGSAALFVDGQEKALVISAEDWQMRGVEQSVTETIVRGPRDSFNENLETNLILLRRRIKHPKLRFEAMTIGTISQTKITIAYIDGIANDEIVNEVKRRLNNIKIDAVLESGYIEQYIEDSPYSLFPTVSNSEKPDIVAGRLLEGRVAIFCDGTPIVLSVPDLLISHFQVSEDYYSRPIFASIIRILRIFSFITAIMLPGVFIAIQYFHPIMIPFSLLISLAKARVDVPFQLYIEVLVMLIIFEIIRESGIRMPRPVGQALSIVGALILGQAAVDAGLVGIPVVVVVAFVGVASFLVNSLADAIAVLRILFTIAGTTLGFYGILLLGMILVTHLASLRSFGVPYTSPLFPIVWREWKDVYVRFPLWMQLKRPKSNRTENVVRQKWGGESGEGKRGKN